MLVSHRHRFIYLKTGKTAGTSVEIYFEPYCVDPGTPFVERHERPAEESRWGIVGYRGADVLGETWFNHMPASRVRELLPADTWEGYLKFAVVRNPFDKVVSFFWFQQSEDDRERLRDTDFKSVRAAFGRWLRDANLPLDRDILMVDGALAVDFLVRYEHLQDDLGSVCGRLGIPWEPARLGRFKSSYRLRSEPYSQYYDPASEELVRRAYDWEFANCGYA